MSAVTNGIPPPRNSTVNSAPDRISPAPHWGYSPGLGRRDFPREKSSKEETRKIDQEPSLGSM
jgi:hypothetical protein